MKVQKSQVIMAGTILRKAGLFTTLLYNFRLCYSSRALYLSGGKGKGLRTLYPSQRSEPTFGITLGMLLLLCNFRLN
uniref:Putative ovule protein n=1 Tax=Solanum chacoense TaxID=4108 RepID=A0A0V0I7W6_SOLCH